jgi:hypothetical protein
MDNDTDTNKDKTPTRMDIGEACKRAAKFFTEHPDKWTKGAYARDADGHGVSEVSDQFKAKGNCYCAIGRVALELVKMKFQWRPDIGTSNAMTLITLAEEAVTPLVPEVVDRGITVRSVPDWNDQQNDAKAVAEKLAEVGEKLCTGEVTP